MTHQSVTLIDIPTEELKVLRSLEHLASSHNTRSDSQAHRQSNQHHIQIAIKFLKKKKNFSAENRLSAERVKRERAQFGFTFTAKDGTSVCNNQICFKTRNMINIELNSTINKNFYNLAYTSACCSKPLRDMTLIYVLS